MLILWRLLRGLSPSLSGNNMLPLRSADRTDCAAIARDG